jgi:hypothetical protein
VISAKWNRPMVGCSPSTRHSMAMAASWQLDTAEPSVVLGHRTKPVGGPARGWLLWVSQDFHNGYSK